MKAHAGDLDDLVHVGGGGFEGEAVLKAGAFSADHPYTQAVIRVSLAFEHGADLVGCGIGDRDHNHSFYVGFD
jgi:hypothetical protein